MRRTLLAVAVVGLIGVAGAFAYLASVTEREFDRLVSEGDAAVQADRPFQAIEAYSGALALDPEAMAPYLKRGVVYRAQGEPDAAMRDLRRAVELDPTAPQSLEALGDLYLDLRRFDTAADHYRRYIAIDDRNAAVLYKLGLARYRDGAPANAATSLLRALDVDEGLNEAHFLLGLCQRDLGQAESSRRTLEDAVKRSPATIEPREALAEVYSGLGEHRRRIEQLEALVTLDAARPERHAAVGLAQAEAGREDEAVLTLGRAVERFPESPAVYGALGHVWLALAEKRDDGVALIKAVDALSQAADHAASTSQTLTDLGRAWMRAGDAPAAERALRLAVTRLPAYPDAFRQLAVVAEQQGRLQEARDALLQYVALVGDRQPLAPVASQIASLSSKVGEPTLAVRWLERLIDESGPSPALLARLADAAWNAGDAVRARSAADEALALAPGDEALVALKRRVESEP
jgi:tetratricopeptide (TPR) repeat protein